MCMCVHADAHVYVHVYVCMRAMYAKYVYYAKNYIYMHSLYGSSQS